MAASAYTFSSVSALLPGVKDDPLPVELGRKRRMVLLTILGTPDNGSTARNYLSLYANEFSKYTPAMLVSMFPEKEFSVLTLIEYLLNFVKVIMLDLKEFTSEISDVMDYWKCMIQDLKRVLQESSLLDVEGASRVEACCNDIVKAVQICKRLEGEAGSCDHTEAENPKQWPNLFPTHFSSNVERNFMTRLQEIYATALEFPSEDRFQDIEDLCKATDLSHVTNSDLQTYAAMQMMITLVEQALGSNCSDGLNLERYNFLVSSVATLNSSAFPSGTESPCFRDFAVYRITRLRALLERAHNIFTKYSSGSTTFKWSEVLPVSATTYEEYIKMYTYTRFMNCYIPGSTTSALEQRLTSPDLVQSFNDMSLSTARFGEKFH